MNGLQLALQHRERISPVDLVLQGNGVSLTVADLCSKIDSFIQVLAETDARTVALYADNCPQWVVVDLACQFAGICVVPIPTFFSTAQIDHLLSVTGADLFVYQEALSNPIDFNSQPFFLPFLDGFCAGVIYPEREISRPPHCSKITFTSGSTGTPKGVCLSFDQCLAVATSLCDAINIHEPRHLCLLPLSTLLENIGGIYMPLLLGGCSIVASPSELGIQGSSGLSTARLLAAIEYFQPSTMILVPQLLCVLDVAMQAGWCPPRSLVFVAVGGARVAAEMVERVRAKGLPVYEGYGLSEAASVVSLNTGSNNKPGSSGKVLPHVSVNSCNGELEVSGNTFLGYLEQPDSWGLQAVKTGDVGHIDSDGFVIVEGRSKNILISSFGRNISPEWVESELMASGVFQQALVLGDGRPFCVALLLPCNKTLADDELLGAVEGVNKSLPDYARVESWIHLDQPLSIQDGFLTENGRFRRDKIAEHFINQIDQLYLQKAEKNVQ